jgi:hypothetical protein
MRLENEQLKLARLGRGDGAAADLAQGRGANPGGPFADIEALRAAAGLPVSRFARLAGIPERTYRYRLGRHHAGQPPKGPWPTGQASAFGVVQGMQAHCNDLIERAELEQHVRVRVRAVDRQRLPGPAVVSITR